MIRDERNSTYVILEVLENNKARVVNSAGKVTIYTYDHLGNVYSNGEIIKKSTVSEQPTLIYDNTGLFNSVNNTWFFDYEYTGNTAVAGPVETIALELLSLLPIIGPLTSVMSVVESFKNQNHTHLYYIAQVFRNGDWSLYKVVTYFYSDRGYRNHVKTTTNFHQMPVGASVIGD